MQVMLGIIAVIIFLLYSIYFLRIIVGNPHSFEEEILKSLADWIIVKGISSRIHIWVMFFVSLWAEILYFYLTLAFIQNPVMRILTVSLIFVEIYHITGLALSLKRFFQGRYRLSQIFNWRVERASAVFFFTHSILVIVIILLY